MALVSCSPCSCSDCADDIRSGGKRLGGEEGGEDEGDRSEPKLWEKTVHNCLPLIKFLKRVVHSFLVIFQLFSCDFLGVTSDLHMAAPINHFSYLQDQIRMEGSLLQRGGRSVISEEENSSRCR